MNELTASELYDGEEPKEPEAEAPETVEGTDDKTEEKSEEKVAPSVPDETNVPLSALHGERDRRQAAERERDELQKRQEEATKADPTSVFEDEGKFRLEIEKSFDSRLTNQNLNQSEFFAADKFGEDVLNEKVQIFKTLVKDTPSLAQRFNDAISPYHELVKIVDEHQLVSEMQDVDALRAKLKEEVRQEFLAEAEKTGEEKEKLRDSIPTSLAKDTSKGGLEGAAWSGPASAESLYDS